MIIIIVVACLGDLQLYNICITFTNIYRVKLEIACVRMSFENIYIYIYAYVVYMSLCLWDGFSSSVFLYFLWVLTVRKEPFWCTFWLEFFVTRSLALSLLRTIFGSVLLMVWELVWYVCNCSSFFGGVSSSFIVLFFRILHWHL